jgi:phosphate transport system permease protein
MTSGSGQPVPAVPRDPARTPTATAERRIHIPRVTAAGAATIGGSAAGALGLTWVLYERVLPFTGVLGFWVSWYLVFMLLYAAMAVIQWDRMEAANRLTSVLFGTGGALALAIVVVVVAYSLAKGWTAVRHLHFLTQTMEFASPTSPLRDGGVLGAMVGSLEQLGLATVFSVPLGLTGALFLASDAGGVLARPVRVIVEAMTALPDLVAGLFIYSLFILSLPSLGFEFSGILAALAISVTMMPIIVRSAEVVIRLVPGTLREASYALGGSQWRTAWNVILPTARSGLVTAVVLAMARGIGETAPVLLTAGFTNDLNLNPFSGPQINLPLYIWNYVHVVGEVPADFSRGFGAGFVLVVVVLILFTIARVLGGAPPGQLSRRQRRQLRRSVVRP